MIFVGAGISNELDSTALSQYIEPSPDTMDRRLAGAAMNVTVGVKITQIVPELANEIVPENPIGQNFYQKIMKEKVSKTVCVEVKKLKLGLNAPLDILRSSAMEGGSGKKRPIPMEMDIDSIASPLKKPRRDLAPLSEAEGGDKQQLGREEFINQAGQDNGSPTLRGRAETLAGVEGLEVQSPALLLCRKKMDMPLNLKTGVDEVKQQLSRFGDSNQSGNGGRKKVYKKRKNKSRADAIPPSVGERVKQPLISTFMEGKVKDSDGPTDQQ